MAEVMSKHYWFNLIRDEEGIEAFRLEIAEDRSSGFYWLNFDDLESLKYLIDNALTGKE